MNLSIHHVGGRWGTIPSITKWAGFFPVFDITLYEPDTAAAEKVRRLDLPSKRGYASLNVQTECLGQQDGASDFHLCFDRSASSMLPFNLACSEYSFFTGSRGRGIYNLGVANRSKTIQVNVRSLGSLIAEGKISVPNLLSIDAEGAGLDILKGVGDKNLENIAGIVLESALIPVHKGESHFHEALAFLTEQGFLCFDLKDTARYSLEKMHIGAFDRGPLYIVQEAVFLKDPSKVDAPEALEKLAVLALLCGAVSVAYACFRKLEKFAQPFAWHTPSENVGLRFLYDFYRTFCAYRDLNLPVMDETATEELSNYMQYSDTLPDQDVSDRWEAHLATTLPKYVPALFKYVETMKSVPTHDVLYEKYGLSELAQSAKAERLKQEEFLTTTLLRAKLIQRV